MQAQSIAVVGSGLAGLASACVLAARGYQVTVFDKNPWFGGKAAVHEKDGYRFDMGPTILTLPSVLHRVFGEADRKLEDYIEMVRLDPQWRCFYDDGSVLDLIEDTQAMAKKLATYATDDQTSQGYVDFQAYSKRLDDISQKYFFWKSVESVTDTLEFSGMFEPKVLSDLLAMRMGFSVAGTIRKHVPDKRVAQMLDHFTQYVGSSPYASPAILCSIAHMQTNEGIWYPMGGTRAVPTGLEKLARELGVTFHANTEITGLQTEGRRVTGVVTKTGQSHSFDAVVSNSDAVRTYTELLDGENRRESVADKYEAACSGVVLYLGLKERYDHLLHHNFVFSRDPEEEFDAIYKAGEPAPDPTAYVCAPAQTEPGVAPEGGEALYVLVHTPYLRPHHDWKKMLPEYRKVIMDKLRKTAGLEDIESRIANEYALTPQTIHERYRVLNGAIYGLASHGKFFGAFKPGNRSKTTENLYLCGGAAHPGPGMPMVLMSGWIAADSLDADRNPKAAPAA